MGIPCQTDGAEATSSSKSVDPPHCANACFEPGAGVRPGPAIQRDWRRGTRRFEVCNTSRCTYSLLISCRSWRRPTLPGRSAPRRTGSSRSFGPRRGRAARGACAKGRCGSSACGSWLRMRLTERLSLTQLPPLCAAARSGWYEVHAQGGPCRPSALGTGCGKHFLNYFVCSPVMFRARHRHLVGSMRGMASTCTVKRTGSAA